MIVIYLLLFSDAKFSPIISPPPPPPGYKPPKKCLRNNRSPGLIFGILRYSYIIYIITSFINSQTTALLHLTSFTEDVTNIGFHMPMWEIFSEFLRSCNLFHKPLGE